MGLFRLAGFALIPSDLCRLGLCGLSAVGHLHELP